jgi:hypothetical protein
MESPYEKSREGSATQMNLPTSSAVITTGRRCKTSIASRVSAPAIDHRIVVKSNNRKYKGADLQELKQGALCCVTRYAIIIPGFLTAKI